MLSVIFGFFVMLVVAYLMATASRMFGESLSFRLAQSLSVGIFCNIVCILSPIVPSVIAMFFLLGILMLMLYLVVWWFPNGSTVKEFAMVAVVDLFLLLVGKSAAARIMGITSIRGITGTVKALPVIGFLLSIGVIVANMVYYNELNHEYLRLKKTNPELFLDEEDEEETEPEKSFIEKIIEKIRRRWGFNEENTTNNCINNSGNRCADC